MERFNNVCRTCNTERLNLVDLSAMWIGGQESNRLTWREILFTVCPSLPIRDENKLPQKICNVCTRRLEIAYVFQIQCLHSDQELWNSLNKNAVKTEPEQVATIKNNNLEQITAPCSEEECRAADTAVNDVHQDYIMVDESEEVFPEDIAESMDEPLPTKTQTPNDADAPFFCCYCDKKYHTVDGLRFHEKLSHKNLKPVLVKAEILTVECKYCRQVFEKKNELVIHCRTEHKSELADELMCNVCQKSFPCKKRLEQHMFYHANNKYQCPVKGCGRDFVVKYKLTDHMKRFHGAALIVTEEVNST